MDPSVQSPGPLDCLPPVTVAVCGWKITIKRGNKEFDEPVCFSRTDAAIFDVVASDDVAAARQT